MMNKYLCMLAEMVPEASLWETILSFYICVYVTTALHEFMHYAVARDFGFRINRFHLGCGIIVYDDGIVSIGLLPFHSYVDWDPINAENDDQINLKITAVFLAGVIGNIACLIYSMAINVVIPGTMIGFIGVALNILLVITNLLPAKVSKNQYNDGAYAVKSLMQHISNPYYMFSA